MFLEHFIKAFWATVIILVVAMCVTSCAAEKYKDLPVHEDTGECVYIMQGIADALEETNGN